MHESAISVLLVEDNPADVCLIEEHLTAQPGFRLACARTLKKAISQLETGAFHAALLDLSLPDSSGLETLAALRAYAPQVPVVVLTGNVDSAIAMRAVAAGAEDYLVKGDFDERILVRSLRYAVERARTKTELMRSERKYRQLYENGMAGVFRIATDGRFLAANPALVRILGFESEQQLLAQSKMASPYADDQELEMLLDSLHADGRVADRELRLVRRDGREVIVLANCHVTANGKENPCIDGTLIDITQRKQQEVRLSQLAQYDELTGLANRYLFTESLGAAIARADRSNEVLALMFLDLDRFKEVNDTLGHGAGDELLRVVAKRLEQCLRGGDLIARLGGDEFAILLEHAQSDESLAQVAEKITTTLSVPALIAGQQISPLTSVGIATYPEAGTDSESLMRAADIAMYKAKSVGGSSYHFYSEAMHASVAARVDLERRLAQALGNDEFFLVYQPKISIPGGQIVEFEALLRWNGSHSLNVGPSEFVPILEQAGQIASVGAWALHTALAMLSGLQKRLRCRELCVSVNVSTRQLTDERIVDDVKSALDRNGLAPRNLKLEITESALMSDVEQCVATLNKLASLGVRIAIDDFGTGFSSLQYLKLLPVQELKIDRVFIQDITTDPDDAAIVQATLALANSLGLIVTAEGIETFEQATAVADSGCHFAQGFLYHRPMPAEELEIVLRSNHAARPSLVSYG